MAAGDGNVLGGCWRWVEERVERDVGVLLVYGMVGF